MKINRAYSRLTIKAVDDNTRTITGIASTPSTDRMGDIVNPTGAKFTLPLPLLWQHDACQPIGSITKATITADGIEIEATIADAPQPGPLQDRLNDAYQSIKMGLVRGLSIGFLPLESEMIPGTWGQNITTWDWLELSAVTIPANAEATISTIKSFDIGAPAALGRKALPVVSSKAPGVSGPKPTPIKETPMNIGQQIKDFQASRAAKAAQLSALLANDGTTLDEAQAQEFDGLQAEIESIDAHLKRLELVQKSQIAGATPVTAANGADPERASAARGGVNTPLVRVEEKLDKGVAFTRYAMCLIKAKGNIQLAQNIAQHNFPQMDGLNAIMKAAVAAGTTTDATWASPLVAYNQYAGDFLEFLRPQTILGRFGVGDVPGLRSIPFNVHVRGQTSGGQGYWVGQGKAKPLTKFDFEDIYMGFTKLAAISVLSEELMRFSNPSAELLVRQSLADALIAEADTSFIDPASAGVAGVQPASVTNTAPHFASSGDTEDDIRADISALWQYADTADLAATGAVYITTPRIARRLALLVNALGQQSFPGVTMNGGTLGGVPLITSNYLPQTTAGSTFILVFAPEIWLADDGQVTLDASREATLQMDSAPTQDSVTPTASTGVSMFQTNSVALRAERYINWQKRRAAAVAYITGVNWGN